MAPATEEPLLLIGTHRSGTTWLGEALSQAPWAAYWKEPRQVWVYGNWFRPHDVLTAEHARPGVVRHIRRRFDGFVRRSGARCLCEKTPSNCLRLPFVHAVYPEARILFLVRDGRHVVLSTEDERRRGVLWYRIRERLLEMRPSELPAFLERVPWFVRALLTGAGRYWGPRPPGWRRWLREDPPDVVAAKQWAATMGRALDDLERIVPPHLARIRYEQLVTEPRATMERVRDTLGLPDLEPVIEYLEATSDSNRHRQRREQAEADRLDPLRRHLEPVMRRLGYEW